MKKLNKFVLSSLLLFAFSFTVSGLVTAASDAGGSASVKGKIIFYEGDRSQPEKPTDSVKPPLHLPQAGEKSEGYQQLGFYLLVLLGGFLVIKKCKEVVTDDY
ncbi:LPXTG cell wall anchor domain-containing protein [Vagococcus sp. BWB3-3]|uniref:LPXTG cell wall anchor domain-containing protein n=1 Tax=Vagococcus allomyrinae TaxID=2794353 RepID=A0A940PCU1_9ENTE|nr:LPXTG cell wall anchor domain-containing protein [Vagococcus allomyrinae]MBP1041151.1 LPXTG cell wall anchor domain-containing protein [Vagococcus allomyrinae]